MVTSNVSIKKTDIIKDYNLRLATESPIAWTKIGNKKYCVYRSFLTIEDTKNNTRTIWEDKYKKDGTKESDGKFDTEIVFSGSKMTYKEHKSDLEEFDFKTKKLQQEIKNKYEKAQQEDFKNDEKLQLLLDQSSASNPKVINQNHYIGEKNGIKYDEVFSDNKIRIKNTKTNETVIIDLNKRLKGMTSGQKKQMIEVLKECNCDVLMDFAKEGTNVGTYVDNGWFQKIMRFIYYGASYDAAGLYYPSTNKIGTSNIDDSGTFIHELGHSVDFHGRTNSDTFSSGEFKKTFNQELKVYKAKGFKTGPDSDMYATTNEIEMFAECYKLLTGYNDITTPGSKFMEYFPKTLALAKKRIDYIRSLPAKNRNAVK